MDIEVVKKLIKKHTTAHADVITKSMVAERYYRNKTDIIQQAKKEGEDVENPLRNADNRIPSNFYGLLVNQKASYMFTAPPLFDVGNEAANKSITEILGDIYAKSCKDLAINASNSGVSWLHIWMNGDKKLEYGVVDSKQIIPIWSSDLNKKLLAVLRVYEDDDDNGDKFNVYEYWTDTECYAYRKLSSSTIDEGLEAYCMFTVVMVDEGVTDQQQSFKHDFGEVPFIPFFNNNLKTSDLDTVKGLIDTYDKVFSGFVNDLEDIQEIIFILTNYDGADLKTFLTELKKYKTIKTENTGPDDKSGLQTLTIDIPVEARDKLLTMTRKAIFEQGQGVDPDPQNFGNSSGVALKYLYSLLELKAGLMETEFRLSFGRFIRMICKHLNIECKTISQTWTRTAITNDSELAEICSKSVGIVSNKSIRKAHPLVEDSAAEEKQIAEEKQEQQAEVDDYKNAFKSQKKDGEKVDGKEE